MLGMKLKLLYLCIVIQKALASGQVNTGASGGKRVNTLQQRGARKGELRLALGELVGSDAAGGLIGDADGTEGLLITHDVLLKGTEKALGMLGSENNAALDLGFSNAWQHTGEVEDEIAAGMSDNGEVGVLALRHLLR